MGQVPEGRGVARNTGMDAHRPIRGDARRSQTCSAFANPKGQAVTTSKFVVVAGSARDVLVSRQDFVVEQKLTDFGLCRIEGKEIPFRQGRRQIGGGGG